MAIPVMEAEEDEILLRVRAAAKAGADVIEIRMDAWQPDLMSCGDKRSGNSQGGSAGLKGNSGSVGLKGDIASAGLIGEQSESDSLAMGRETDELLTRRMRKIAAAAGDAVLLYTLRTASEGGRFTGDEACYNRVVRAACDSGFADLIDIEFRRSGAGELLAYAHSHGVKVVSSYHDFHGFPGEEALLELLRGMEAAGADVAKIACMPEKATDTALLEAAGARALRELTVPFLLIAMGESGRASRLSGEIFGSCMTFGCLGDEASAPGQIELSDLREELERVHGKRSEGPFIFLIGFMGAGKSSVAEAVRGRTGLPVLEMDAAIEAAAGKSIPEIFEEYGETYFRDLETALLAGLYDQERAIVSCGGGCALRPGNRALMRALGKTVLLEASPETVLCRLTGQSEGRPLIRNRMTLEGIRDLMDSRRAAYEEASDVHIKTDELTIDDVSGKVLSCVTT